QVLVHLAAGLVEGLERSARELELPAGLQRDRAIALRERDRVAVLQHQFPAEALQALEERADSIRSVIGHATEVGAPEHKLLVLGADAPPLPRLAAGLDVLDELAPIGDGHARGLRGTGHELERLSESPMFKVPPTPAPATRAVSLRRLAASPPEAP